MRRMNPADPVSRRHEERLVGAADYVVLDRGQDRLLIAGCNLPLRGVGVGTQVRQGNQNATVVAVEDKALKTEFINGRIMRWLGDTSSNLAAGGAAAGAALLGSRLGALLGKAGLAGLVIAAGAAAATKTVLVMRDEGSARIDADTREQACQRAVREATLEASEAPTVLRR
jgi:hypothetical protein